MQNIRPNHNINLPTKEGKSVSATIKTPVLKIKRKVQELTVKSIALSEECLETFKLTKGVNERLAAAFATPEAEKIREDRTALLTKINTLNKEQFDTEIEQLKLIVNLPNEGEAKRGHDDIDWEEIPEDEIKEAINFFVNGPKS
jgi:hypothetical protein